MTVTPENLSRARTSWCLYDWANSAFAASVMVTLFPPYFRSLALGAGFLDADTDLVMTGLIDSLGVMMVVEWLERRLAIVVDPNDVVIEHFASVTAIVEYLRSRDDCRVE